MPADDLRAAILARLEDPSARALVADVMVRLLENAPLPPVPPSPPRGPRRRRAKGEEPRPENYKNEHSFNQAKTVWKKELEELGQPLPSSALTRPSLVVTKPVTNDSARVTNDRPSDVTNGHEPSHSPVTNDVTNDPFVTRVARASEPPSLSISEENQPKTVVVVSGDSGPQTPMREVTNDSHRVSHSAPIRDSARVTPETRSPETAGDNNNNSMLALSPEAERIRKLLCVESDGKIAGVLLGNRRAAFNEIVEALRGEYSDAEWVAFARLVKDRKAKWWTGGFSLPALCNPASEKATPCYGLTRGLEETRKLAVPVRVAAVEAKPAPAARALTLDEMRAAIGAMPEMRRPIAAGGER